VRFRGHHFEMNRVGFPFRSSLKSPSKCLTHDFKNPRTHDPTNPQFTCLSPFCPMSSSEYDGFPSQVPSFPLFWLDDFRLHWYCTGTRTGSLNTSSPPSYTPVLPSPLALALEALRVAWCSVPWSLVSSPHFLDPGPWSLRANSHLTRLQAPFEPPLACLAAVHLQLLG